VTKPKAYRGKAFNHLKTVCLGKKSKLERFFIIIYLVPLYNFFSPPQKKKKKKKTRTFRFQNRISNLQRTHVYPIVYTHINSDLGFMPMDWIWRHHYVLCYSYQLDRWSVLRCEVNLFFSCNIKKWCSNITGVCFFLKQKLMTRVIDHIDLIR
jgi:hypothetical protein